MDNVLCYDIMEMIGKEYDLIKQTNKNKKLYGEIVKHLDYYFDEYKMYEEKWGRHVNVRLIWSGDRRVDTKFLEYEDLWSSNHYKVIANDWGGEEEYEYWCAAYF